MAISQCENIRKMPAKGGLCGCRCGGYLAMSPSSISMAPHSIWPSMMCISWMRAVVSDGTTSRWSARPCHVAAAFAAERGGDEPHGLGLLERGEDVGALAGGGDGDGHVARLAERLDLAGEDALEAEIVAGGGKRGGVGGEGERGDGGAVRSCSGRSIRSRDAGRRRRCRHCRRTKACRRRATKSTQAPVRPAKAAASASSVLRATSRCSANSALKNAARSMLSRLAAEFRHRLAQRLVDDRALVAR